MVLPFLLRVRRNRRRVSCSTPSSSAYSQLEICATQIVDLLYCNTAIMSDVGGFVESAAWVNRVAISNLVNCFADLVMLAHTSTDS